MPWGTGSRVQACCKAQEVQAVEEWLRIHCSMETHDPLVPVRPAQVWDTRKLKAPLHVWEGLPASFESTKARSRVPSVHAPRHPGSCIA